MGHEKSLTGLMAALAGANLIYGPGMLESGITFDFVQLVMDNEFAHMIKHTLKGFEVDEASLAVDVIHQIGPGKDFLSHAHTFDHMHSQSKSELIDRKGTEDWKAAGGRDIYHKSREKAEAILDTHKPAPLPGHVASAIKALIEETEAEMGVDSRLVT